MDHPGEEAPEGATAGDERLGGAGGAPGDDTRAEVLARMEWHRSRLIDAAPGSPEWDAARAALDELEWQLVRLEGPAPDEESI